ncbi:hypothetical protein B0T22DRAFT_478754 [Podospora appendiculata]|uniref:Steroid 5-alpha reductase C-terminal domain-containing protein n=1 Tax=Podospora appendiculata TaxID=314037 RepID=A0AAE0X842_9PEZI|nr:hypothetical protein B0T22DRAFT_478754 [Podospora appendiculata]
MSSQTPPTSGDNEPKHTGLGKDLIQRGVYKSNPLGTATFIGLRSLDPFLQYQILAHGWGSSLLTKLGLSTIPLYASGTPVATMMHETGIRLLDSLNLPLPRLILLAMATGSTLKQIFWLTCTSKEEFPPRAAATVSAYNTFVNSLASMLLISTATSAALSTPLVTIPGTSLSVSLPTAVGAAMYAVGMALETVPEIQRRRFKDAPENRGRICDAGPWGWARHINYGGYTIWRTGYAVAAGGWTAGAVVAAWHLWTFAFRSIGLMDEYMSGRYAERWAQYKKDVPWLLFPGIY